MEPVRINIPSRKPENAAADIVIEAFKRNGIDPRKAFTNPMCRTMSIEWSQGRLTDAEFNKCCENMLVLNPGLKL